MQKNTRKRTTPATSPHQARAVRLNQYPFPFPDVVDMDSLGAVPDEELITKLRNLEEQRSNIMYASLDPKAWEVELAYIRRELQLRRSRRDAHDRYIRTIEREFQELEASLPVADLDNSYFLKVIGEWN